jgi:putative peptide maturation dehydrogenase
MKVKRTKFLFFYHRNNKFVDFAKLLEGEVELNQDKQLLCIALLLGDEIPISDTLFEQLKDIPLDEWVEINTLSLSKVDLEFVIEKGLVILDSPNTENSKLFKERDDILTNENWNIYGALYHFMTKWKDIDVQYDIEPLKGKENVDKYNKSLNQVFDVHGDPLSHFHKAGDFENRVELPLIEKENLFYQVLKNRKTTRSFNVHSFMRTEDLSVLLRYTFGCHGTFHMHPKLTMLKKNSPSGGSLHPTEVYLLINKVKDIKCGIYHYNVESHSLCPINNDYTESQSRELARTFSAGQLYTGDAHVLFVFTTRYYRNLWKYQQHSKSYSVMIRDAAHLCQNLYLVCAELGLGAFTAACNTKNIEEELGIDGFREGVTMFAGCGVPLKLEEDNLVEPNYAPYKIKR